jgi:hypothetical protein
MNSHKLEKDEEKENWFKLSIDLNTYHLDEKGKIMLRIVDKSGTESHIIPPCCYFIEDGYGIFKRYNSIKT